MRNVLISGGSIAGLSLAYWLRRYGFAVTVVERAPAPRPGGHAVDLRGVAKQVAERMGIMRQIRQARVHEEGMAYVDARGTVKATMPATLFDGEGAVAEIEILRGDLTDILYAAAGPHVEYLFDDSIASLTERHEGVHVTFERAPARVFDIVVGADGLHSTVRRLAMGPEERFVKYLGAYNAYFTIPTGGLNLGPWFLVHTMPGAKLAAIRPDGPDTAKAMFSFKTDPLTYDRHDIQQQKRILAEKFAGGTWHTPRLIDAVWQAPDFFFDSVSQVHADRWSTGRTVLLGDAGYCGSPLSGNGTAMAVVGAYVLAGELAAAGGDHVAAFDRYETLMRPYVKECQQLPPGGVNGFLPGSRLAIGVQRTMIKMMTSGPLAKLGAKATQKASSITLKDYQAADGPVIKAPR
ncbi:FAD-dependent monooxygenase [Nonomuraea sp. NPDC005501]|uniref:FAD-dependent monooxygenase n=1 Tax=Nonomuraea sp. NPDC005501 TaxID=3156884 RepID=UPI0033A7232A